MAREITVSVLVRAPIDEAWSYWTSPEHISGWCFASDTWQAPRATNDVRVGGTFTTRMEAKDGSAGFDFGGTYEAVEEPVKLAYVMDDGRRVTVLFAPEAEGTRVTETFDAEGENAPEMQREGWQAILENFKRYAESRDEGA